MNLNPEQLNRVAAAAAKARAGTLPPKPKSAPVTGLDRAVARVQSMRADDARAAAADDARAEFERKAERAMAEARAARVVAKARADAEAIAKITNRAPATAQPSPAPAAPVHSPAGAVGPIRPVVGLPKISRADNPPCTNADWPGIRAGLEARGYLCTRRWVDGRYEAAMRPEDLS